MEEVKRDVQKNINAKKGNRDKTELLLGSTSISSYYSNFLIHTLLGNLIHPY